MERVREMAKAKRDVPVFPGTISVFEYPPETRTSSDCPAHQTAFCSFLFHHALQNPPPNCLACVRGSKLDARLCGDIVSSFHVSMREGNLIRHPSPTVTVPQTTAIFDGQHRCHALHQILESNSGLNLQIMVEVFRVTVVFPSAPFPPADSAITFPSSSPNCRKPNH